MPTYELFSSTEILGRMALERMLAGLSTRRYQIGLEPVGQQVSEVATATSRSAVSRKFVAQTETALAELLNADFEHSGPGGDDDRRGALRRVLLCRGVWHRPAGHRASAGIWRELDRESHPGNGSACRAARPRLGRDRADPGCARRQQRPAQGRSWTSWTIRSSFGANRTRSGTFPTSSRSTCVGRLARRCARFRADSALLAEAQFQAFARELDKTHPRVAASLREGLAETLTVLRLGVPPMLAHAALDQRHRVHDRSQTATVREREALARRNMAMRWRAAEGGRGRQAVPSRQRPPAPREPAHRPRTRGRRNSRRYLP